MADNNEVQEVITSIDRPSPSLRVQRVRTCIERPSPSLRTILSGDYIIPWATLVYFQWYQRKSEDLDALPPGISLIGYFGRKVGRLNFMVTSPDGLVYTACDSTIVWVWNKTEVDMGFNAMISGPVHAAVAGPDDQVISSHHDGTIKVWKREDNKSSSYKQIMTLPTRVDRIINMFRRLNNNFLSIYGQGAPISCLGLCGDKKFLYSGSWDNIVKVWCLTDGRLVDTIKIYGPKTFFSERNAAKVTAIVTGPPGVFFGSNDGVITLYRRIIHKRKNVVKHHYVFPIFNHETTAVHALLFKSNRDCGGKLFAGLGDGTLRFWIGKTNWGCSTVLSYHKKAVTCLASLSGSLLVFSGSLDGTICVWNNEAYSHKPLMVLTPHQGSVHCLAIRKDWEENTDGQSRRGLVLYSNGEDGTVKIWRIAPLENNNDYII